MELHRRTYDEGSAVFRTYDQLTTGRTRLFTTFLAKTARVNPRRSSLGFAFRLEIRVPQYEVDNLLFDDYYEGGVLFSDKLNIEFSPLAEGLGKVRFGWDSRTPNRTSRPLQLVEEDGNLSGSISFGRRNVHPGITGNICFTITPWNAST